MSETPEELGRRLVAEMGRPRTEEEFDDSATAALRWGAEDLDDDAVWRALLAALDAAQEDGDLFLIADGMLFESVFTRDGFHLQFEQLLTAGNAKAIRLVEVMSTEKWNWEGPEMVAWWQGMLALRPS